ncbi:MAG: hypothetical protein WC632_02125 [Candidatus Margulisiibacteriota bacterium]
MNVRVRPVQADMMRARTSHPLVALKRTATYLGAAALMGCGAEMGAPATPCPTPSAAPAPSASASAAPVKEERECSSIELRKAADIIVFDNYVPYLPPYHQKVLIEAILNKIGDIKDSLCDHEQFLAYSLPRDKNFTVATALEVVQWAGQKVEAGTEKVVPGKDSKITLKLNPEKVADKTVPYDPDWGYEIEVVSNVVGPSQRSSFFPAEFKGNTLTAVVKLDKEQLKKHNVNVYYYPKKTVKDGRFYIASLGNPFVAGPAAKPAQKPAQKPEKKPEAKSTTTTTAPVKKTHCSEHPEDCL